MVVVDCKQMTIAEQEERARLILSDNQIADLINPGATRLLAAWISESNFHYGAVANTPGLVIPERHLHIDEYKSAVKRTIDLRAAEVHAIRVHMSKHVEQRQDQTDCDLTLNLQAKEADYRPSLDPHMRKLH